MAKTSKKNVSDAPETTPAAPIPPPEPEMPIETAQSEPEPPPTPESQPEAPEPEAPEPEAAQPKKRHRPTDDEANNEPNVLQRTAALDSWEGVLLYLYRTRPYTNKLLNGQRHVHVKRYDQAIDIQDILEEAGSGAYLIQCTRRDPKTGKRPMFDSGEIRILNPNYPPKIPPGEWVDDPRNKEWEWARDVIFPKKVEAPAAPPPDPLVEIMREQLAAQRIETAELRKEMREAAAKKDPTEQTLISIIVPFVPAIVARLTAPATPDPTQALFMQYLMKQAEAKQEAVAADPMKSLEQQFELSSKMEERYGNRGGRSRKSATQEFITDMTAAAAPIIAPIVQVIAQGVLQQQRTQQQQPQPQPAQYQPQPAQYQPPQVAAPPSPLAGAGQAPPANLSQGPGPQIVKDAPNIEAIAQAVVDHVESNLSGVDLGDWYIEKYGREEFDEVRMQGKSAIIRDLNAVPLFEKAELENGIVDQLISDFLLWEPAEDNDEDDEDAPPPAAVAPIKSGWTQPVAAQEPSR